MRPIKDNTQVPRAWIHRSVHEQKPPSRRSANCVAKAVRRRARLHLENRDWAARAPPRYRHQGVVRREIKQLLPIAPPARLGSSCRRDALLVAHGGKVGYVDLGRTRFV